MQGPSSEMLILTVLVLLSGTSAVLGFFTRGNPRPQVPRCRAASQPCRLRATMTEMNPAKPAEHSRRDLPTSDICACPPRFPCAHDFDDDANSDKILTKELRTNGRINMTLSLMFCVPMAPAYQDICGRQDIALRLKGYSSIPTELDVFNCTCPDSRPLVLHRQHIGPDFYTYSDFVCSSHMRRCNVEWNPDVCMVHVPETQSVMYPCKCPENTVCREGDSIPFRCLPMGD